jgi:hypothetical protein
MSTSPSKGVEVSKIFLGKDILINIILFIKD